MVDLWPNGLGFDGRLALCSAAQVAASSSRERVPIASKRRVSRRPLDALSSAVLSVRLLPCWLCWVVQPCRSEARAVG